MQHLVTIARILSFGDKLRIVKVFRKNRNRILPFTLSLLLALILGCQTLGTQVKSTEILWDTYGIPHIYGQDATSAFRAFGWAQMQSHGNLLLRLYGQARGHAAQYWGEDYIDSDRWMLTMGVPERARVWYEAQDASFRNYLDAFANGINTYVKSNPDAIDDSVEVVLPVKGEDILAHLQRVLNFTFIVSPQQVAGVSNDESKAGSNGWAIAPSRSASGNAMLLANPHILCEDGEQVQN